MRVMLIDYIPAFWKLIAPVAWVENLLRAAALLVVMACSPAVSHAAPTDCIGTSQDGIAKCTAPLVSGYTYGLCSSSLLIVAVAKENACYVGLGISGVPIKQEGVLQALIDCMHGQSGPSWMASGSANGFFCGGTVTYKYGQEVVGISEGIPYDYGGLQPTRSKSAVCPVGYNPVGGTSGLPDYCIQVPKCPCETTPDPMGIVNGDQNLTETDIGPTDASPLEFTRHYSSSAYYRPVNAANPQTVAFAAATALNLDWNLMPGFGDFWRHTYDRKIVVESLPYLMASALRPDGTSKHFRADGTSVLNEDGRSDTLLPMRDAQGNQTGWIYTTEDSIETYAATGELWNITTRSGRSVSMVYSGGVGQVGGLLLEVDDDVGHFLKFAYDDKYRVTSVTDSAGNVFKYGYSGDALLSTVMDPVAGQRTYLYGENPQGKNGGAYGLTGILDDAGQRIATYGYAGDSAQAYAEQSGSVDHYERSVVDSTHVNMTDPLGATRNYTVQNVGGVSRISSVSQPAGFGSSASVSSKTFDSAGNVASIDDFDGHRTCRSSDPTRLLEGTRVEGLATTVSCSSVVAAGSNLPAGTRKISTLWHPDWKIESRIAEPGRITTYVYNGQSDPTAGNAIASCAPSTALLPGGKPIAVLCAKVEQGTLDVNGSQDFSAALDPSVPERRVRYTYNGRGQILTSTDAGNHTTTYAYYEAPTANANTGDLLSVTNPAGHVTTYDVYDKNGLALQSTDPNGVVTTMIYDGRRRPVNVSIASGGAIQSITYSYNLSGDLTRIVLPDGKVITRNYDAGHRLVGMTDSAGNTVTYILDDAGNRISEQFTDANGALAASISRAYDALGRMYRLTGVPQ